MEIMSPMLSMSRPTPKNSIQRNGSPKLKLAHSGGIFSSKPHFRSRSKGARLPQLQKPLFSLSEQQRKVVSLFFGCLIEPVEEDQFKFKYVVGKGNNHPLVTQVICKRLGARPSVKENCHFVWQQVSDPQMSKTHISTLPKRHLAEAGVDIDDVDRLVFLVATCKLFDCRDFDLIRQCLSHRATKGKASILILPSLVFENHMRGSYILGRKSTLTELIIDKKKKAKEDPFSIIPRSFIMKQDSYKDDLKGLENLINVMRTISFPLIVKPGENANRGHGISVVYNEDELSKSVKGCFENRAQTVIVQSYLKTPLLFKDRKFDIRCYALVVRSCNGLHCFWYKLGYARTSSYTYNANDKLNLMVHLTNEAVQVKSRLSLLRSNHFRKT